MSFFRHHQKASHRVIARILELSHGVSNPSEEMLEELSYNFRKNNGSWLRFFKSDPTHIKLLKESVKETMENLK